MVAESSNEKESWGTTLRFAFKNALKIAALTFTFYIIAGAIVQLTGGDIGWRFWTFMFAWLFATEVVENWLGNRSARGGH